MPSTLEDMLSGKGQGSYTPTSTPASAFERGSYLSPEELSTIQGFAGVRRDPKGNYGGFNADQVRGFQSLYNTLTPEQPIKVDGIHGDQTAAAAYDLLSRYGSAKPSKAAPSYTPTEEAPLSFDEYTGRSPLADIIEQFKPKKDISEERMNRAAGFAALGAALRNVVDAHYGSQGAQIVQHTDPEWVMRLAQRSEQLKDQRKGEELRYNMLRLQDATRGRDRYDAYRDRIMERNMNNRDYATRSKHENDSKQYWYDRQRADHLSDYARNKADQYTMIDKQTAKQKELARFNSNLQEGAWERRMKKLKELGVTSTGKSSDGSTGGSGKPFMTYFDKGSGRNVPLTDGQAMEVINWAFSNKLITDSDISAMRQSLNGVGSKNEVIRLVQKTMPAYLKAAGAGAASAQPRNSAAPNLRMRQDQPKAPQQPAPRKTGGAPRSAAIPKSVGLMIQNGFSPDEAFSQYDELSAQGYSDEDIYSVIQ